LIAVYSLPSDFDSSLVSIFARLNTLETHTTCLKECYGMLREHHDYMPINSEPSSWFPTVKITVKLFMLVVILCLNFALCLRMFMNLWELSEGGEEVSLTNNSTIFPVGIAEGVFTKILGIMVPTDYLIIECVGNGQITLGRSLLKLMGAVIDVGKGTMKFTSPSGNHHVFSRRRSKGNRGRHKASGDISALFENT
jgi:hypothetical protein